MVYYVSIIFTTIIIFLCLYLKWLYTYWERKKIPYIAPALYVVAWILSLKHRVHRSLQVQRIYDVFKGKGCKHVGLYIDFKPSYFPIDLELIKRILCKDFSYFTDRGGVINEESDLLSQHLFNQRGEEWAKLRKKLTPVFTPNKMKIMVSSLVECSKHMEETVEQMFKRAEPINVYEIARCFTMDVIGSCCFGVKCNSFVDTKHEFLTNAKNALAICPYQWVTLLLLKIMNAKLAKFLNISLKPNHVTNFFVNLVEATVHYREKNNVLHNDFMQALMDLKDDKDDFSIQQITANTYLFFVAGHETSSITMSFCLYELTKRPDIQERIRQEVNDCLQKYEKLTYEALEEMTYLEQVVSETLRKYPAIPGTMRICVKDYTIPDTNTVIEKGTLVLIPIFALHYDPEYYLNPYEFDPDRFSKENCTNRLPYTYLPFGEGPRKCIGICFPAIDLRKSKIVLASKFGIMQIKIGLITLLRKYTISINKKRKFLFSLT